MFPFHKKKETRRSVVTDRFSSEPPPPPPPPQKKKCFIVVDSIGQQLHLPSTVFCRERERERETFPTVGSVAAAAFQLFTGVGGRGGGGGGAEGGGGRRRRRWRNNKTPLRRRFMAGNQNGLGKRERESERERERDEKEEVRLPDADRLWPFFFFATRRWGRPSDQQAMAAINFRKTRARNTR